MKIEVRPLEGADLLRGVDELRTRIYPGHPDAHDAERHSAVWRWLRSHPLGGELHRWVLVAEGGEVVGHLAALPQYYWINGRRIVAHTPADYQVLPGYGFYALSLMRRFFRTAGNCVSVDQVEEAMAVEKRFGAEEAGKFGYEAKLMEPSRIPGIPEPLGRLLKPARGGLRALDTAAAGLFGGGPRTEVIDGFDASFDGLFESVASSVPCVPEKDAAFLRWRYGPGSPSHPVTVLGVREEGACNRRALLGYAVLWVDREGDDGLLLDLVVRPGRYDVARSLLGGAVRFFVKAGVYIVRYRFARSSASPRARDLRAFGFFPRSGRRHTMLVRFADRDLHETAVDAANWSYAAGDGEVSFWVW